MNDSYYTYEQPQFQFGFGGGITKAVRYLLIANGVMFFLQLLLPNLGLEYWLGLSRSGISKFFVWQLVTYQFLHGGFIHILLNMFLLWMFGGEIERQLGDREFMIYYILCGVGGGILHLLINPAIVIGASGAIYGLMVAYAVLYPNRRILLFPIFLPVKAKYVVMIWIGISLVVGISGGEHNVAHFAHLGGALVGFLYFKFNNRISISTEFFKKKYDERRLMSLARKRRHVAQIKEEVDAILDKINENGYEALSEHEKRTLKQASDIFSKE